MNNFELIKSGSFIKGDIFSEGEQIEKPIHKVDLNDFYLSKNLLTVKEFEEFILKTNYKTSAESDSDSTKQKEHLNKFFQMKKNNDENADVFYFNAIEIGGSWCFKENNWILESDANWKNPHIKQTEDHPVVCISWLDAINYCNWKSKEENLPIAYDIENDTLLDEFGKATTDISKVKGYRLPTESEWEFAAREGGKNLRFGTGSNIISTKEANYNSHIENDYSLNGAYLKSTTPIASFKSNRLNIYDMCGNSWEWCMDSFSLYTKDDKVNPCSLDGVMKIAKGGRWGGSAEELRISKRVQYAKMDRCNNMSFRLARSK